MFSYHILDVEFVVDVFAILGNRSKSLRDLNKQKSPQTNINGSGFQLYCISEIQKYDI